MKPGRSLHLVLTTAMTVAFLLGLRGIGLASDGERVVMQPPARNAAMLALMPGFVNRLQARTISGSARTLNDGLVIRKSYVRDGKVVIPPGGLYLTARSANWWPFENEPVAIAGKLYRFITDEYSQDVVRNITMKPGQTVFCNAARTRGWELLSIDQDFGIKGAYAAAFMLVKTTGNYYGNSFKVIMGPNVKTMDSRGGVAKGARMPAGITPTFAQKNSSEFIVGNNMATAGRSLVVVDSLSPTEARVRELITVSTTRALISPNDPLMASCAVGDTFRAGSADVEITSVSDDSVGVRITDAEGSVSKTLGPMNDKTMEWMPMSLDARARFFVMSKKGDVLVHLNIYKPGGPFEPGKASLAVYSGVLTITDGSPWTPDGRFLARPEICAACTYPHEILIENDKPIVLDAANNTFTGPDGYFKIVLDAFDGVTVSEWHLENSKGERSPNLAPSARGGHLDLVVGKACRSTGHFFSRFYSSRSE